MKKGCMWLVLLIVTVLVLGAPLIYSLFKSDYTPEKKVKATEMEVYDVKKEKMVCYDGSDNDIFVVQIMEVEHPLPEIRVYPMDEENYDLFDSFGSLSEKYRNESIIFLSIMIPPCSCTLGKDIFGNDYDMDDITWPLNMDVHWSIYSYYFDEFQEKDSIIVVIDRDFNVVSITGILNEAPISNMVDNLLEFGYVDLDDIPEQVELRTRTMLGTYASMISFGLLSSACPCCFVLLYGSATAMHRIYSGKLGRKGKHITVSNGIEISIAFALGNTLVFSIFGFLVPVLSSSLHRRDTIGLISGSIVFLIGAYLMYKQVKEFRAYIHGLKHDPDQKGLSCCSGICKVHHHESEDHVSEHDHIHEQEHDHGDKHHHDHEHHHYDLLNLQKRDDVFGRYPFWLTAFIFGIFFGILCAPCSMMLISLSLVTLSAMSVNLIMAILFMALVGFFSGIVISVILFFREVIDKGVDRYKWFFYTVQILFIILSVGIILYGLYLGSISLGYEIKLSGFFGIVGDEPGNVRNCMYGWEEVKYIIIACR